MEDDDELMALVIARCETMGEFDPTYIQGYAKGIIDACLLFIKSDLLKLKAPV